MEADLGHRQPAGLPRRRRTFLTGGNFHGEPVALARRLAQDRARGNRRDMSERTSISCSLNAEERGLPLVPDGTLGTASGLMIVQYAAAALVQRATRAWRGRTASDSIPTSAGQKITYSMGMTSAAIWVRVSRTSKAWLACELLGALRRTDFRRPPSGAGTQAAYGVGATIAPLDRAIAPCARYCGRARTDPRRVCSSRGWKAAGLPLHWEHGIK